MIGILANFPTYIELFQPDQHVTCVMLAKYETIHQITYQVAYGASPHQTYHECSMEKIPILIF